MICQLASFCFAVIFFALALTFKDFLSNMPAMNFRTAHSHHHALNNDGVV